MSVEPELRICLEHSCVDYVAHSVLGGTCARILFAGNFNGKCVLWDATIESVQGKQFIDINEFKDHRCKIHIGLNLTLITEPVVLKTLLMVRQYKNLRPGRHEFSGIKANK